MTFYIITNNFIIIPIIFYKYIIIQFDRILSSTIIYKLSSNWLYFIIHFDKNKTKSKNTKKEDNQVVVWKVSYKNNKIPKQTHDYDSGVFVLAYADFLSNNIEINFFDSDIYKFRVKIASTILRN